MVQVTSAEGRTVSALAFVGTPDNEHFGGYQPPTEVAAVIASSSGPSGHNVEYFLKLYHALKERDQHLEDVYAALQVAAQQQVAQVEAELGVE